MNTCIHERVYNSGLALLIPPYKEWICRKCGDTGIEAIEESDGKEYNELKEKFMIEGIKGGHNHAK